MNKLNELLNFKNKKERNDFLIALIVLAFFAWLMWWIFLKSSGEPLLVSDENIPTQTATTQLDSDGDGIIDSEDRCPKVAGVIENHGCPADTDGDGVYDTEDQCPEVYGEGEDGCPIHKDTDGDGIIDSEDRCPKVAGVPENYGCPADRDGDGVYDINDKCPDIKGLKHNHGCPEVKVKPEEAIALKEAVQNVEFKTGSAELLRTSRPSLYRVVKIMKKYPNYRLNIEGHTDNTGETNNNKTLSVERAKTCYNYFISNGIDAERMEYKGHGENRPIDSNETKEGRKNNRRVEFKLSY